MAGRVGEKDAARLLQGLALVVSRMVELQTAQSAGSAAESRWTHAAHSAGHAYPVHSSQGPKGASVKYPDVPGGHADLVAALALEQAARREAEERITTLLNTQHALRIRLAEAEGRVHFEQAAAAPSTKVETAPQQQGAEVQRNESQTGLTRESPATQAVTPPQQGDAGFGGAEEKESHTGLAGTDTGLAGLVHQARVNSAAQGAVGTTGQASVVHASTPASQDDAPKTNEQGHVPLARESGSTPTSIPGTRPPTQPASPAAAATPDTSDVPRPWRAKESSVPTNPLMRVAQFGVLGLGMGIGVLAEAGRRAWDGTVVSGGGLKGLVLSGANSDRLTATLCRMRGAALKLGQLLSIQDEHVIPKDSPLRAVIDRVREEAETMPSSQLYMVLAQELGQDWRSLFKDFDHKPFAAASIGQVHLATTQEGDEVCVKVQYPGVADSIDADIAALSTLLSPLAPKGLFLTTALEELRVAMKAECDYYKEASMTVNMRRMLAGDSSYGVPKVYSALSSKRVITSQRMHGVPIDQVASMDQETRDRAALAMMKLTLIELFSLNIMQTDPNWSNFLYDTKEHRINLIDFGAAVKYDQNFCVDYGRLVTAASLQDREEVIKVSLKMGFLTGKETGEFLDAHCAAAFITGEPFRGGLYDFGTCRMTERNSAHIATMLSGRLTAPPRPVYTLHRKLSGVFLACMRLRARIECRPLFEQLFLNKTFT